MTQLNLKTIVKMFFDPTVDLRCCFCSTSRPGFHLEDGMNIEIAATLRGYNIVCK